MFQQVLAFWFSEIDAKLWWQKDPEFDSMIRYKFGDLHRQATQGELYSWRNTPESSLAEIIILDQFSRNIYRDKPEAFKFDLAALVLAQIAIGNGFDLKLPPIKRSFIYLPYMHSESAVIHSEAVKLYEALGNVTNLDFEYKHKAIIDRFGRFPHRNKVLDRESTSEELEFLKQPDSSF